MESSAAGSPSQAKLLAQLIGGDGAHGIARRLLDSFGSIGRIIAASPDAVARRAGSAGVAERISAARELILAGQTEAIERTVFDLREPRLQRYLVALFRGHAIEQIHAIYLDTGYRYLAGERMAAGAAGHVSGSKRELISRAIDLGAAGVVLAHNHPSGKVAPSRADITETKELARLLGELELALVDHVIIAGDEILSMRGAGLL